ncbi:uncharacterized protein YegL [Paenibacillus sp. V4I3]|uniref:IPT/TIG domain-containing protein n=1 Tax=Paenibacillus sp. V4I3 TaxID=3042305 RepID=UPI002785754A|nr:IPT/TIG domain-containing protein [Paenibacillus sp. V4I3]MDQ0872139.1 uncharacterized protein YegL [Paenibacillus sp. V4I3]
MKRFRKNVLLALVLILAFSGFSVPFTSKSNAAVNDYVSVTKSVNPSTITTEQEAEVTLDIKGTPPANIIMPNDVILIIDKSGSMGTSYGNGVTKMSAAKDAAKGFIDLMDLTKHEVGIVDFSSEGVTGTFPLTTDATAAKSYINTLSANGATATGYSIDQAIALLSNHRPDAQPVIVIMTDGEATLPTQNPYEYALQKAQLAKDAGIVFYTIALLSPTDNPDTSGPNILLKQMSTTEQHHHFVLGTTGLSEIYSNIVKEIGVASAYNVVVTDTVSSDFDIVPGSYDNNIPKPTVSGNTLTWNFQELKNNNLVFKYKIKPKDSNKTGNLAVSASTSNISYKDYAGAVRSRLIPDAYVNVTFPAPIVTSIVNDNGSPNGGETVTINGSKFRPGAIVTFGSFPATNVQVVSGEQITATVPAGAQGVVTVTVSNPDKQKATTNYQYMANPTVSLINPNNGPLAGGNIVTFTGNYFMSGIQVKFGDIIAPIYMNTNATYLKVTAPAGVKEGVVDISFQNPDGSSLTIPGGYTYIAPPVEKLEIQSVTPNTGLVTGKDIVYIVGNKFESGLKVYFGNDEAPIITYYSGQKIKVTSPVVANAGTVDVKVVNPDNTSATMAGGFTYNQLPIQQAPSITDITPNSGPIAGGDILYINGANFVQGMNLFFGSTQVPVSTFYSSSRIKVVSPASTLAGPVDVKVVNPDGQENILASGYTFIAPPPPAAPVVTTLTPNSGEKIGGEIIYIDGQNFVNGVKIYFGSNQANVLTYYSASRLKVSAPSSTLAGQVDVKAVNPDSQEGTLAKGYTYLTPPPLPAPLINSLTPNKGLLPGGELIVINGTGFQQGATVTFGSKTVNLTTFTSAIKVSVTAPSSASVGTVDVKITNPDGQSFTFVQGYTYELPVPTITNLTPNHGPLAGGTVVYIDGTNFDPNMTVKLNGQSVPISSYYGSTRIKIITPSSAVSGSLPLVFTNPTGTTATSAFTYDAPPPTPAPVITKLSATSGTVAGGEILYIDGTGFSPNLKLYFGSTEVPLLTYYSDLRLKIRVPAGTLGFVAVKIVNPDGQQSSVVQYQYK